MSCHVATFAKDLGEVMSCHVATFAKKMTTYDIDICLNPDDIYAHLKLQVCHAEYRHSLCVFPLLTTHTFVSMTCR